MNTDIKISNISFARKIPVASCQIKERETDNFKKATIYEYDCKDLSDIKDLENLALTFDWEYAFEIMGHAYSKYYQTQKGDKVGQVFSMEDEAGNIVGLCDTDRGEKTQIVYLEAHDRDKYCYIGQNFIAMLSKRALNHTKQSLTICDIQESAMDFYKKTCGFKNFIKNDRITNVEVPRHELPQFIRQTEKRCGKIIDYKL